MLGDAGVCTNDGEGYALGRDGVATTGFREEIGSLVISGECC